MLIHRKSAITGIERTRNIPVNPEDYIAWEKGHGNVSDLMPYLNDADREFILSGITAREWAEAFRNTEELA